MGTTDAIAQDVAAIGRIDAVPTILRTVAHLTGMRFTAVARVTDTRWIACATYDEIEFGLQPGGELELETTICNEIRQHHQPVVFGQASLHPVFRDHPTPKRYGFESYLSVPIVRRDGSLFGTLCAIDPLPAKLDDPHLLETLRLFTQLIAAQLDADDHIARVDLQLHQARDRARLREQFIAVLGHDLRNPLQAISMGAEMLRLDPLPPSALRNVERIQGSVERMAEMIQDILDFARGRLGGGIPVALHAHDDLGTELMQVVTEARTAHPDRAVETDLRIDAAVTCDCRRVAQLLDNLLANALHHGVPDRPVRVAAVCADGHFELAVENHGPGISEEKKAHLFQPFSRTLDDAPGAGLGLGLYIASEIARAHRGTLTLSSSDASGTRFVLRMPLV